MDDDADMLTGFGVLLAAAVGLIGVVLINGDASPEKVRTVFTIQAVDRSEPAVTAEAIEVTAPKPQPRKVDPALLTKVEKVRISG